MSILLAHTAIMTYQVLCMEMSCIAQISKEQDIEENNMDIMLNDIENRIKGLEGKNGKPLIDSLEEFYKLDLKPDKFYEPLDMIKNRKYGEAIPILNRMDKTIKYKIEKYFCKCKRFT